MMQKKVAPGMKRLELRLPLQLYAQVQEMANRESRSLSNMVQAILEERMRLKYEESAHYVYGVKVPQKGS